AVIDIDSGIADWDASVSIIDSDCGEVILGVDIGSSHLIGDLGEGSVLEGVNDGFQFRQFLDLSVDLSGHSLLVLLECSLDLLEVLIEGLVSLFKGLLDSGVYVLNYGLHGTDILGS